MATSPSGLNYNAIRKYAEDVARHHNSYDASGRLDLDSLMRSLSARIEYLDTNESSYVDAQGMLTIYIPHSTSVRRDRFTIAHELGHYFLHWLYPRKTGAEAFGRGGRDLAETEANVFASSLLMPEDSFRAIHRAVGGDTWAIAHHFDVSPAAASVRCQVLGLLRG